MANLNIGVQVVERQAITTPAVVPSDLSNVGIVFAAAQGPVNKAVRLSTILEDRKIFGAPISGQYGSYVKRALLNNSGQAGAVLYCVRVAGSGATAASKQIAAGSTGDTKVKGKVQHADYDAVDVIVGAATSALATEKKITVKINTGAQVCSVTPSITATEAMPKDVAFTAGKTTLPPEGGVIKIENEYFRYVRKVGTSFSGTSPTITGTLTLTERAVYGSTAAAHTGPIAATFEEIFDNVSIDKLAKALSQGVSGINGGFPSYLITPVYGGNVLPGDATYNLAADGSDYSIVLDATGVATTISAAYKGTASPGVWGNKLRITFEAVPGAVQNRNVYVYLLDENNILVQQEFWPELTQDNWATKLNSESAFIKVDSPIGSIPNPVSELALTAGVDGSAPTVADFIGLSSAGTGLYALDGQDIQLVTCADETSSEMAAALETYAAARGTLIAIASTSYPSPSISTLQSTWGPLLLKSNSTLAVYRGWIRVSDEKGGKVWIPNVGHVLGAGFIRNMNFNGGKPHIAPAGDGSYFNDVLEVEIPGYLDNDLKTLVNAGINAIMQMPGRGFIVRTSRTMSTSNVYYHVHVRRSLQYIKSTLKNSLGWIEQQPNNDITRRRLRDAILFFLQREYNEGMFDRTGGFTNNVAVVCDESNNPESIVRQRQLVCDITVRIVEAVETATINLLATDSGVAVSE